MLNLSYQPPSDEVFRGLLYRRLLGIALSIASFAFFVVHRYHLGKIFREHANPKRLYDLMNIGEHYGISSAQDEKRGTMESKGNEPGVIKGPCGFWVAELLGPDDGKPTGHIVGCVGIGELFLYRLRIGEKSNTNL